MHDAARAFDDALAALAVDPVDPVLLPDRLARACKIALSVDGAGLTCTFSPDRRLPIGSSDPEAAAAERLQFSIGEGPCLSAHAEQRMVAAGGEELAGRWPVYAAQLAARTDYRGVIAIPVPGALSRVAAVNVFLRTPDTARVVEADLVVVAAAIGEALGVDLADSGDRPLGLPTWLDGGPVGDRQQVWRAVGYLVGRDGGSAGEAIARLRARAFALDEDLESLAGAVLAGRDTGGPDVR